MIYNIYWNKNVKVFKLSIYILTGQIGSGKSEAQKIFQNLKYSCFCADSIVRDLYKEDYIINKIKQILPEIVNDRDINMDLMRELLFSNHKLMKKIEDYIQPLVFNEFQNIIGSYKENIIFIIPIIRNTQFFKKYKTIYIYADEKKRRERIQSRNNYNKEMINSIFSYQKSIDNYKTNSDYIIENNGTLEELKKKLLKIVK